MWRNPIALLQKRELLHPGEIIEVTAVAHTAPLQRAHARDYVSGQGEVRRMQFARGWVSEFTTAGPYTGDVPCCQLHQKQPQQHGSLFLS